MTGSVMGIPSWWIFSEAPPREYPLVCDEPHGDHIFGDHDCTTCLSILEKQDIRQEAWDAGSADGFEKGGQYILGRGIKFTRELLEKHQDDKAITDVLREVVGHFRGLLSVYTDQDGALHEQPDADMAPRTEPPGLIGSCSSGFHVYGECGCPSSGFWPTASGSATTVARE